MGKKAKADRKPTNPWLAATKLKNAADIRAKAASWVASVLCREAGLSPAPIPDSDPLQLWGLGSEQAMVRIASKFNTAMQRKRSKRPPDLILNVFGRTVGDLVDFISNNLSRKPATQPAAPPLVEPVALKESAADGNFDTQLIVDLTVPGDGRSNRIRRFTIMFLAQGYPPVTTATPLGVINRDGRTLDVLAGAFPRSFGSRLQTHGRGQSDKFSVRPPSHSALYNGNKLR